MTTATVAVGAMVKAVAVARARAVTRAVLSAAVVYHCRGGSDSDSDGNDGDSDGGDDESDGGSGGDGEIGKDNNLLRGSAEETTAAATVMAAETSTAMERATLTARITIVTPKPTTAHRRQ